MIKLLTTEEYFVDTGKAIYKENELVFEGTKTRGKWKQKYFNIADIADYEALLAVIKELELDDYIQMEHDGKLVVIRAITEE